MSAYGLWDTATCGGCEVEITRPYLTIARQQIVPNVDEILTWTRSIANALCSIVCSVSNSVIALIQHVETSMEHGRS